MKKPYPKRLRKSPIIEAVVEIRFQSSFPKQVIFGLLYATLQEIYPKVEPLPIMEIPETIRENDPNLLYAPHYKLKNETPLEILIGPTVLTVSYNRQISTLEYPGWTEFIESKIHEIYKRIQNASVITQVTRLGIRYMDYFESINIFENIEFTAILSDNKVGNEETMIRTIICDETAKHAIAIMNKAQLQMHGTTLNGSLIDIDTFKELSEKDNFFEEHVNLLKICHESNKEHFFKMLKDEFVLTLDPES